MKKKVNNCKKCTKRKITILNVGGKQMIDSLELYKTSGLLKQNYTRWMKNTVLSLGCIHKDYVPAPNNVKKRINTKNRLRYYLKIDFAISICLAIRRNKSIEIRNYLIASKK